MGLGCIANSVFGAIEDKKCRAQQRAQGGKVQ